MNGFNKIMKKQMTTMKILNHHGICMKAMKLFQNYKIFGKKMKDP